MEATATKRDYWRKWYNERGGRDRVLMSRHITQPLLYEAKKYMDLSEIFCRGLACPVRNTCLRYTEGVCKSSEESYFISKCTNQRRFLQDESAINEDSKKNK